MNVLPARRQGYLISAAIAAAAWWFFGIYELALKNSQGLSGWILVVLITLLMLYNMRKKISFLPMGSNVVWLQIHLFTGAIAFFIFLLHIGWRWPGGNIEILLALVFVLVCLSGVVGIWMSRRFAKRLTHKGEQLLFERIPAFAHALRLAAEQLVEKSIDETESTTLADFYVRKLAAYFHQPNFSLEHIFLSRRRYIRLHNELRSHQRYMNNQEQVFSGEMAELLTRKNYLDQQYSLQKTLKYWLFAHIPLSYSLLLILSAHIVLVYGFGAI